MDIKNVEANVEEAYEDIVETLKKKRKIEDMTESIMFMSRECKMLDKKIKEHVKEINDNM